jgi:hypothetical protein
MDQTGGSRGGRETRLGRGEKVGHGQRLSNRERKGKRGEGESAAVRSEDEDERL